MSGARKKKWPTNLSTIKTFDLGKGPLKNILETNSSFSELKTKYGMFPRNFSASMAIVCLVEKLCSFLEKDPLKCHNLTEVWLKQLNGVGILDDKLDISEFEQMREDFRKALCTMLSSTQQLMAGHDPKTSLQPVIRSMDEVDGPCKNRSRYTTDFELLGFISRGGFGQVFRVRNRLDGCKYAIKEIFVKSQDDLYRSILNEVTLLAKLQHPNIVKYYTAWLEPVTCDRIPSLQIVEEDDESIVSFKQEKHHWAFVETKHHSHKISSVSNKLTTIEESSGSSYIQFRTDSTESGLESSIVNSQEKDSLQDEVHSSFSESNSCSYSAEQAAIVPRTSEQKRPGQAVLYIQMELCGRSLRQWLDWHPVDAEPSSMLGSLQLRTRLSCFWQLAAALEYLHAQGIVHHDIKPSNIFVFGNNRLKLGDFGLACSYEHSKDIVHHAWGTCTYAAPEQLEGGLCNFKSDIYSTGLVLLELLMPPLHTNAERIHILSKLREEGVVPDIIAKQLPLWGALAIRLTQLDPYTRPTAKKLKSKTEILMCHDPSISQGKPVDGLKFNSAAQKKENNFTTRQPNSSPHLSQMDEASQPKTTFQMENGFSDFQSLDGLSLDGTHRYLNSYLSFLRLSQRQRRNTTTMNGHNEYESRVEDLELENQILRTQMVEQEYRIKLLQEQVRLLGLQL